MSFNWIGLVFWLLIGVSLFILAWGIRRKSSKAFVLSGIALVLPSLYFIGAENWLRFVAFLPIICFYLAYSIRKSAK
ncbi:hypothetical protein [Neobacillus drentensis]|uniref:hypothetical protein n=1 Tax=Neobacillus drentensis TaxID=220684 RepID=UPI003002CFE9